MTEEQLRKLYLADLASPDTYHGRTTPKARHPEHWKFIESYCPNGRTVVDPMQPGRDIWLWSDIHFGHQNIINYCNRPYPNWRLMNECFEGNYTNVVKPQDIVIFGGDIGFMKEDKINEILYRLPGYKIQIVGNHDMHRNGKLYELAFDERHLCMIVDICDVDDLEYQLLFTHYPLDVENVPVGCYNVHGHIHDKVVPSKTHINICVEHTHFRPMHINEIVLKKTTPLEKMRKGLV